MEYEPSAGASAGRFEAMIQQQALVKTAHPALEHGCLGVVTAVCLLDVHETLNGGFEMFGGDAA